MKRDIDAEVLRAALPLTPIAPASESHLKEFINKDELLRAGDQVVAVFLAATTGEDAKQASQRTSVIKVKSLTVRGATNALALSNGAFKSLLKLIKGRGKVSQVLLTAVLFRLPSQAAKSAQALVERLHAQNDQRLLSLLEGSACIRLRFERAIED